MEITKDKQIKKFSYYGFFKNIKFFEPYLFIYFLNNGLDFFNIGVLFSIKEAIVYIFEIPSGVIADYYGKKSELKVCFIMYIISFILFFIGKNYMIMIIAMMFFGLGDALRSGTHKSMIYSYLEINNVFHLKNKVYGYTRSYSKLGSAISSFLSIAIILNIKHYKTIFLFSIVPYLADFLLINSYPDYLNEKSKSKLSIKEVIILIKKQLKSIFSNKKLNIYVFNSSIYNSIYSIVKDYIQPIIVLLILSLIDNGNFSVDDLTKVILGVLYGFFSIGSILVSRYSYKANKYLSSERIMNISYILFALILISVSFFIKINSIIVLTILFFFIYISKDLRKVNFVEIAGNHMKKEERATVMSYNNQLKSILIIIISPIVGYIADYYSISRMFLILGISLIIIIGILKIIIDKID